MPPWVLSLRKKVFNKVGGPPPNKKRAQIIPGFKIPWAPPGGFPTSFFFFTEQLKKKAGFLILNYTNWVFLKVVNKKSEKKKKVFNPPPPKKNRSPKAEGGKKFFKPKKNWEGKKKSPHGLPLISLKVLKPPPLGTPPKILGPKIPPYAGGKARRETLFPFPPPFDKN